jgi:hypothetical protein
MPLQELKDRVIAVLGNFAMHLIIKSAEDTIYFYLTIPFHMGTKPAPASIITGKILKDR